MATALDRRPLTAEQLKALRKRKLGDYNPQLELQNADFHGVSLAGFDLRCLDLRGADLTDADLTTANIERTDLRDAILTPDKIILATNWPLAHYSDPQALGLPQNHEERLQARTLTGNRLRCVNFSDADLDSYNLERAQLEGSVFYDASLVGAHLEHVDDLAAWQFRGANLTGAHLPEAINKFEGLKAVENNTKSAARSWTATVLACLYCWLTIGTTTDAEFFGAEHATVLPFLQMKISPNGFYAVAPLLLAITFLYLQFSLHQLWEAFASLPAFFPDGRPLHERASPFFLSSIVRIQFRRLREKTPGLAKTQAFLAWLLGWWVVPFTITLLWWRSLVARLAWLTAVQVFALAVVITASLFFISVARATLRGVPAGEFDSGLQWLLGARFPRKVFWALLVSAALSVFSVEVFLYSSESASRALFPFPADLAYAKLSPAEVGNTTGEGGEPRVNSLDGRNLKGCDAVFAAMANVDLRGADLSYCNFDGADMRNADLTGANLHSANFGRANLRGARLPLASDFGFFKG